MDPQYRCGGRGRLGAGRSKGYTLEYDAARKIAQGLGAHLDKLGQLVEVKGSDARLLPVTERAGYLFGKEGLETAGRPARKQQPQLSFLDLAQATDVDTREWGDLAATNLGQTVLDRVHQSMLLFAAGRSDALSALYPPTTDEKRWVDGVLARKKGLGF